MNANTTMPYTYIQKDPHCFLENRAASALPPYPHITTHCTPRMLLIFGPAIVIVGPFTDIPVLVDLTFRIVVLAVLSRSACGSVKVAGSSGPNSNGRNEIVVIS